MMAALQISTQHTMPRFYLPTLSATIRDERGPGPLFLEIAIFCNLMSPEIVYLRSDFIILLLFSKVPLTATEDGNQIKCKPASGIVYTMGFCKMAEMTAAAETVLL